MPRLCETELCTGCTACASVCPYGCIAMRPDSEGFLRPVVDSRRCMDCGLCTKSCPVLAAPDKHPMPRAYAAKNRNETVRAVSTDGGLFTLLAQQVLEEGGAVVGAAFDADLHVEHAVALQSELLPRLRGAKYAQSDARGLFAQVKTLLEGGRRVLFCGTPCQVAGLQSFLGREEPRLILLDVVCKGVASPAVWERYLAHRCAMEGDGLRPTAVSQCSKPGPAMDISWPYGKSYRRDAREDAFLRAWAGGLCLRPSCHRCSAKGLSRVADITLGTGPSSAADSKGTTLVLLHSDKAVALWDQVAHALSAQEADPRQSADSFALQSAPLHAEERALFLHRYDTEDFDALVEELLPRETGSDHLAHRMAGRLKRLFGF